MPHDQGALMAWDKKEKAQKPHGSEGRTKLPAPRAKEVAINST
jgi:hypothetical protein